MKTRWIFFQLAILILVASTWSQQFNTSPRHKFTHKHISTHNENHPQQFRPVTELLNDSVVSNKLIRQHTPAKIKKISREVQPEQRIPINASHQGIVEQHQTFQPTRAHLRPEEDILRQQQQQQQQQQQIFEPKRQRISESTAVHNLPPLDATQQKPVLQQDVQQVKRKTEQTTLSPDEELARNQAKNAKYSFDSEVKDSIMDNTHIRQEKRDGLALSGLYSYSDGFYKRTVHYKADENGYRVTREEIEPIGNGPQLNPNGQAVINTNIGGVQNKYSITAADIKQREELEEEEMQ